jgi:hypothetical protein
MSDLATQILLQIQEQQVKDAKTLGEMASSIRTLADGHSTVSKDVEDLKKKDWKQSASSEESCS